MARHRSLDEFLDTDDDGEDRPSLETLDGVTRTYGWTPGGAVCPDCGERTDRTWRVRGRSVCPDCKEW